MDPPGASTPATQTPPRPAFDLEADLFPPWTVQTGISINPGSSAGGSSGKHFNAFEFGADKSPEPQHPSSESPLEKKSSQQPQKRNALQQWENEEYDPDSIEKLPTYSQKIKDKLSLQQPKESDLQQKHSVKSKAHTEGARTVPKKPQGRKRKASDALEALDVYENDLEDLSPPKQAKRPSAARQTKKSAPKKSAPKKQRSGLATQEPAKLSDESSDETRGLYDMYDSDFKPAGTKKSNAKKSPAAAPVKKSPVSAPPGDDIYDVSPAGKTSMAVKKSAGPRKTLPVAEPEDDHIESPPAAKKSIRSTTAQNKNSTKSRLKPKEPKVSWSENFAKKVMAKKALVNEKASSDAQSFDNQDEDISSPAVKPLRKSNARPARKLRETKVERPTRMPGKKKAPRHDTIPQPVVAEDAEVRQTRQETRPKPQLTVIENKKIRETQQKPKNIAIAANPPDAASSSAQDQADDISPSVRAASSKKPEVAANDSIVISSDKSSGVEPTTEEDSGSLPPMIAAQKQKRPSEHLMEVDEVQSPISPQDATIEQPPDSKAKRRKSAASTPGLKASKRNVRKDLETVNQTEPDIDKREVSAAVRKQTQTSRSGLQSCVGPIADMDMGLLADEIRDKKQSEHQKKAEAAAITRPTKQSVPEPDPARAFGQTSFVEEARIESLEKQMNRMTELLQQHLRNPEVRTASQERPLGDGVAEPRFSNIAPKLQSQVLMQPPTAKVVDAPFLLHRQDGTSRPDMMQPVVAPVIDENASLSLPPRLSRLPNITNTSREEPEHHNMLMGNSRSGYSRPQVENPASGYTSTRAQETNARIQQAFSNTITGMAGIGMGVPHNHQTLNAESQMASSTLHENMHALTTRFLEHLGSKEGALKHVTNDYRRNGARYVQLMKKMHDKELSDTEGRFKAYCSDFSDMCHQGCDEMNRFQEKIGALEVRSSGNKNRTSALSQLKAVLGEME